MRGHGEPWIRFAMSDLWENRSK